jgi:hypothetical protein
LVTYGRTSPELKGMPTVLPKKRVLIFILSMRTILEYTINSFDLKNLCIEIFVTINSPVISLPVISQKAGARACMGKLGNSVPIEMSFN